MKYLFLIAFAIFGTLSIHAQPLKKTASATRIQSRPTIDGILNDSCWKVAEPATDFIEFEPVNGRPSTYRSVVYTVYTDYAIYVGAMLYDPVPDSIMKELSRRDEIGQSDFFGVSFDLFNDALTGYTFIITPSNVQFDARETLEEDAGWDGVWESAATINSQGWVAEMEIPWSTLRFSKKEVQLWGMNLVRNVQRTREKSFWNPVDPKISSFLKQNGQLTGIKHIVPPVRLSFSPYISGYLLKNPESRSFGYSIKGGLDLKYGINESYTLDLMLIPDFGQVESDDEVLNISPFETFYEEKRPFFMEGTELFAKGDIFYSRRIGGAPAKYWDVEDELTGREKIYENPNETQLINVTKFSGKGKKGLGIGFLNGMSAESLATLKDSVTGDKRTMVTQPFTNYNAFVLDQSLKNNSFVSLTNTNYYQPHADYMANVSAVQFDWQTKKGNYSLNGIGGVSYINDQHLSDSTGFKYQLMFEKITGNFKFQLEQSVATKTFNPNDMGYLDKTDELKNQLELVYNIYQPFWRMLKWYNSLEFTHYSLLSERKKIGNELNLNTFTTFRNYLSVNLWSDIYLTQYNDFYEPRVSGRVFRRYPGVVLGGMVSPDYRKKFVVDVNGGYWKTYNGNQYGYWWGFQPIVRLTDHFNFTLSSNFEEDYNDQGFVDKNEANDTLVFGGRILSTLTNSLRVNYVFNSKSALSFRLRHYWRTVNYLDFYYLNRDGTLTKQTEWASDNINYTNFTIDMMYTWRFAPGSELSLVWKNSLDNEITDVSESYFKNVDRMAGLGHGNSLSFRVLYYIDYLKIGQKFKS